MYFSKRADVAMAFLFGSRAKGYAKNISDWDIGVYLKSDNEKMADIEREIWTAVEKITGAETDLVILNRAPSSIAWNIVRGEPLAINDRKIYLNFLIDTSHEANDWYRTADDYHRVFSRSASLSREDKGRIEKIIQFLTTEVSDFSKFEKMTWTDYTDNRSKKRDVERWVEQMINAVIDVSEIILASERRIIPETYREIVKTLGTVAPFKESDVCQTLSGWTELRNVLAHQYLDYRWNKISAFIKEAKPTIIAFLDKVKIFLEL